MTLQKRILGRARLIAAVFVAVAAVGGGLFVLLAQTQPPGPVVSETSLEGISVEELALHGYVLEALDAEVRPGVSRARAEQLAEDEFPSVTVRDAVFARIISGAPFLPLDRAAWVVSLNPNGVTMPGPEAAVKHFVVVLDADTGEFMFAFARSEIAEGAEPYPPRPGPISPPVSLD